MSDIIALASVGVSVDISISGDGGRIGISFSFSINILMFASLPSNYRYKPVKNYNDETAQKYLKHCMVELKTIYTGWEQYLKDSQQDLQGVVFSSMDEVEEHAKKVIIRRVDYVKRIEDLIREINAEIPKYSNCSAKVRDSFLIMLSNCYQAFRDLAVSFYVGEHSLEIDVLLSDEMLKLRENYFSDATYGHALSMGKIKKRRSISEQIFTTRETLSQKRIEKHECAAKIAVADKQAEELKAFAPYAEETKRMLSESVEQCVNDYKDKLIKQLSYVKEKLDKFTKLQSELEEAARKSAFGKRKKFLQIECVKRYIPRLEKCYASLEEKISQAEKDMEYRKTKAIEECKSIDALPVVQKELQSLTEQQMLLDSEISSCSETLKKLEKDYEEFMETWPVLL